MFFDDYPQFSETGEVGAGQDRLNLRYEAIFATNRDIFQGATVLDLASYDGRWSFAALRTGASHVIGVEARQSAVDKAHENFSDSGEDPDSYRFICGDVFDVLSKEKFDVDIVLCLGYIYHTYRHAELLYRIRCIDPEHVIIDSHVVPDLEQPFVKLIIERQPDKPGNAALDAYSLDRALVGRPSVPALRTMLRAYDFGVEHMYDWHGLLAAHPRATQVGDYARDERVTMRCRTGVAASSTAETHTAADFGATAASPAVVHDLGQDGGRWRLLVNRGLAKATGYELRRTPPSRSN